jgi:uncharacterized protein
MTRRQLLALFACASFSLSLAACASDPTMAQAELPKEKLVIVTHDGRKHIFHVEMALTRAQQEIGLMFRTAVPPRGGMLFDFGTPQLSPMWMKNTVSSLDILFIDQDGVVRGLVERTTPESLSTIKSPVPVRATLELAAGTAERLGIRAGDKVQNRIFGTAL